MASAPIRRFIVTGDSMLPTYANGDLVFALRSNKARAGQVRVLEHPHRPGMWLVKRVGSVRDDGPENLPELMLFDKAEKAASREILLASLAKIEQIISEDGASQALERRRDIIRDLIEQLDDETTNGD